MSKPPKLKRPSRPLLWPNPFTTPRGLGMLVLVALSVGYLLFSCSGALPGPAQAKVMCYLGVVQSLPMSREAAEALPLGEARDLLVNTVTRAQACKNPGDAGAP